MMLRRYTPQLRFDSQELYYADAASMATDNFVDTGNRKTSYSNSLIAGDNTTLAKATNTGTTKLSLSYLPSRLSGLAYPGWPTRFPQDVDHLQENNSTVQTDAQRMDAAAQYGNHIYGHAQYDGGHWWLAYWFYYYYNP